MGIGDTIGKRARASVLVIAGPTASGKSAAALRVAEALDGVVINADSMQVYCELPVLTAQPTAGDRARAPHRLYGTLPAAERCTAGRWRTLALSEIAVALAACRLPIVVGGTGLYLKALMDGLSSVPPVPPEVRAAAAARHAELGSAAFHAELARLDPVMAARVAPGDSQRVRRAYEVMRATGRSLAGYQATNERAPYRFLPLLFLPPREILYAACDARCRRMLESGALEEVAALRALRLDPGLPALKALGVRELGALLSGEIGRTDALLMFQRATRQYAKRQYTWFRNQLSAAHVFGTQFSESLAPEIFTLIRKLIDRPVQGS
jgi:tRNA dimethylallyltransferase